MITTEPTLQGLTLYKCQATGNDFVCLDGRAASLPKTGLEDAYAALCHRRYGLGADGVIVLAPVPEGGNASFEMWYYNADGRLGSMCGNGGRAAVWLAHQLGYFGSEGNLLAYDGLHHAAVLGHGMVRLQMNVPGGAPQPLKERSWYANTGSPHYVAWVSKHALDDLDVVSAGRVIRNSPEWRIDGVNVNFVAEVAPWHLQVRTYERGVEDETYSCGTGVTACALVQAAILKTDGDFDCKVDTRGGTLHVQRHKGTLWLAGPAQTVFTARLGME